MIKSYIFIVTALIALSGIAEASNEGKILYEKKCINCHTLERSLAKDKTMDEWKRTVMRMSSYTFGVISSDETEKIAMYLSGMSKSMDPERAREIKKIAKLDEEDVFSFKKVRVEQFIDPETCKNCHSEIYDMWKGSMHSKAFIDPIWQAATQLFVKEAVTAGEVLEMKACVKCHTPLGFRSYAINSPASGYDKVKGLPSQGIFCNWCHNISQLKHVGDAQYEVDPGGGEDDPSTMLGPYKDSYSNIHPSKYSDLLTKSEFCGLCHNVSHAANGLPLENTYNEWKNSPYNTGDPATTVHCQDCHMRQKPGVPATGSTARPDNPGKASQYGPERKHVGTHYFVGGNALVTELTGSSVNAKMAVERLQNAADMEIIADGSYGRDQLATIKIKVTNTGSGHYLPTGLTEIRQMWLDVKITDNRGEVLSHSGALDDKGTINKGAVIFNTVLGDGQGKPVINVSKAQQVLYDHRIPPKGYVVETYTFLIPADAAFPLHVEASLMYRSASQSLVNRLLGEDAPEIPVIDMVSKSGDIKL